MQTTEEKIIVQTVVSYIAIGVIEELQYILKVFDGSVSYNTQKYNWAKEVLDNSQGIEELQKHYTYYRQMGEEAMETIGECLKEAKQ